MQEGFWISFNCHTLTVFVIFTGAKCKARNSAGWYYAHVSFLFILSISRLYHTYPNNSLLNTLLTLMHGKNCTPKKFTKNLNILTLFWNFLGDTTAENIFVKVANTHSPPEKKRGMGDV